MKYRPLANQSLLNMTPLKATLPPSPPFFHPLPTWSLAWSSLLENGNVCYTVCRGFIKGGAPGKLTGCEQDLAINLPGCFRLLFLLSFLRKTKNARLKNPTDLLHKTLMKPLPQLVMFSNSTWLLVKTKENVAMAGKSMSWICLCQMILVWCSNNCIF